MFGRGKKNNKQEIVEKKKGKYDYIKLGQTGMVGYPFDHAEVLQAIANEHAINNKLLALKLLNDKPNGLNGSDEVWDFIQEIAYQHFDSNLRPDPLRAKKS